ncbi:hypothetical protein Y032_0342g3017 [Ancylostoma ceylanicum]|uniref:Uncharacterized protein n=1 Tax=Ancylostoma ceylanicum TaxID=53326 RepID=A0A016RYF8_9BILA|nr:hypothetical protein Y032_0342g3017 [Ancylostoma ceylanicum]
MFVVLLFASCSFFLTRIARFTSHFFSMMLGFSFIKGFFLQVHTCVPKCRYAPITQRLLSMWPTGTDSG